MALTGVFTLAVEGIETAKVITGSPVMAADVETASGFVTISVTKCCRYAPRASVRYVVADPFTSVNTVTGDMEPRLTEKSTRLLTCKAGAPF